MTRSNLFTNLVSKIMSKPTKKDLQGVLQESIASHLIQEGITEDSFQGFADKAIKNHIKDNADGYKERFMEAVKEIILKDRQINVYTPEGKELPEITHKQFEQLCRIIASSVPALMVGMPGTGKTSAARQTAEHFDIDFRSISVGVQTTKSDILGFIDAGGNYKSTGFREAFEEGGLFLMDEIDAGNPNVLIIINSAISNGFCQFPDGMVEAHDDFHFVATANTYGTGADAKFIGRNKLDEATLDRFITINWEIDENLEELLADNSDWFSRVKSLRSYVDNNTYELMVTPRISIHGAMLIDAGFTLMEAAEMTVMKGHDEDTKDMIKRQMNL